MNRQIKNNTDKYKVVVEKDQPGFLAKITGKEGIVAWGETREEALKEMEYVLDALIDIQLEEIENERFLRNSIRSKIKPHALQVS
jgi:predicted RNase H-like HicB family nuclease